jgi:putative flippase GtrA
MLKEIKQYARHFLSKEFLFFVLASGFAFLVNFLSRIFLSCFLSYPISITIAYLFGMVTAFTLNKFFVFKKKDGRAKKEAIIFVIVNLIALIQVLVFACLLREIIFPKLNFDFYPAGVAHFIGLGSTAITSYLGHKKFTFGDDIIKAK